VSVFGKSNITDIQHTIYVCVHLVRAVINDNRV